MTLEWRSRSRRQSSRVGATTPEARARFERGSLMTMRAGTTWSGCVGQRVRMHTLRGDWDRLPPRRSELVVSNVGHENLGHCRHDLPPDPHAAHGVVRRRVVPHEPEGRHLGTQIAAHLRARLSPEAWATLHRLRSAMARPGRDRLTGVVEMDETLLGGVRPGGKGGRTPGEKILVGVGIERRAPRGFGRCRLSVLPNASTESLAAFLAA